MVYDPRDIVQLSPFTCLDFEQNFIKEKSLFFSANKIQFQDFFQAGIGP